jgi:feruloyl esterase
MSKRIVVGFAGAALAVLFPWGAGAQAASDCATLEDLRVEDTNLLSSTVVPAADDLPEYCRVQGYVRPAINFEIRLPTTTWTASST